MGGKKTLLASGALVGLCAILLTYLGNPANMGFASPALYETSPAAWDCTVQRLCNTSAQRSSALSAAPV